MILSVPTKIIVLSTSGRKAISLSPDISQQAADNVMGIKTLCTDHKMSFNRLGVFLSWHY